MLESARLRLANSWRAFYYMSIEGSYPLAKSLSVVSSIMGGEIASGSLLVDVPVAAGVVRLDGCHHPDWRVFRGIYIERTYETKYDRSVVIDVGAHRGLYSAYALSSGCHALLAFEPEPANFELLRENIALASSPHQTARAYQKVVAATEDSVEFYVYDESWSHSTTRRPDKSLSRTISVEAMSIDDVINQANELRPEDGRIILKIDVEGSEYDLIGGASDRSLQSVDEIFVETHAQEGRSLSVFLDSLRKAGLSPAPGYHHNAGVHELHHYARH